MTEQTKINLLNRLELQGFKSFAGKTIFEFPAKVVGVVGPNGSGKSNIIDAIRWVLGEREAKQLRGEGLENLIFAGTPKKAAQGFARVDLVLDNKNRAFPVDAEEVVLSRRVDRSGTSEFSLNDAEIKLKDLLPLLARVRLGARGIMIIGQGQSDIFVMSSPRERREMIEEFLGLREFRIKKSQAERRLESSLVNIDKIKAMLEELAPQVRVFKKQKTRLEKRSEVEAELRGLEGSYYSFKYSKLDREQKTLLGPIANLKIEREKLEKNIQDEEKILNTLYKNDDGYAAMKELRNRMNAFVDAESSKQRELSRIEAKMEIQKEAPPYIYKPTELHDFINELKAKMEAVLALDNVTDMKNRLRELVEGVKKFFSKKEEREEIDFTADREKLAKEIGELKSHIEALRKEEEEISRKARESNVEFREKVGMLNEKKNNLYLLDRKTQTLALQRETVEMKLEELQREWAALGRNFEDLKRMQTGAEFGENELRGAESRMLRLRGELAAIGDIDENIFKEFEESEKRYEFLEAQLADLEKAAIDLKALIKDLDQRIKEDFKTSFKAISDAFNEYFKLMFGGGKAKLVIEEKERQPFLSEEMGAESSSAGVPESKEEQEQELGVNIDLSLPRKKITGVGMLSGGEKTLVSLAALFALISISPPPFLVLDEIDAALDEENARRFSELIRQFSTKTQFIVVTHNRSTMEAAEVLYGITMGDDGVSKVLSLKLEG
jgi:chromosome segregation protein